MYSTYRFWERPSKRSSTGKMFYVMFASRPGKWISSGQDNYKDAVIWAENHLENPEGNIRNNHVTFKQFANGFFTKDPHGWRKRQIRKNKDFPDIYYKAHQGRLDNYIIPQFGDMLLPAINARTIDNWFLDLEESKKNTTLSDNSKNKILFCFRIVLDEAENQGVIKENPARKVTPITERSSKREIFTNEEIQQLFPSRNEDFLKIWLTYDWYLFFKIQAVCGLRPGEVAALSWGDFHLELSGLVISKSVDYSTGKIKGLKTEKKGMKEKVSILDKKTRQEIQEFKNIQKNHSPLQLIFMSINGNTLKPEISLKHFKASCRRANIELKSRTQYSLRHTFDTELLKQLSRDNVNDLMGHTSYRAEYDHRSPKDRLRQLQHVKQVITAAWS